MSSAGQTARKAGNSDALRLLGRVGLVSYGVVNLLLAFLAAQVAMGDNEKADKNGALGTIAEQPFGKALLWIIAVGLFALALWQLAEAIWGFTYAGKDRTKRRITSAGKAVAFGFLSYSAVKVATGKSGGSSTSTIAKIMESTAGRILIGIVGVAVVAVAVAIVHHGVTKRFTEDLDLAGANAGARRTAERLGQIGYSALGVVYGTVGILIVVAAVRYDPEKASGLDGALKTLAAQPFGVVLLWIIALGLACYGVYCFFDARYRRG